MHEGRVRGVAKRGQVANQGWTIIKVLKVHFSPFLPGSSLLLGKEYRNATSYQNTRTFVLGRYMHGAKLYM